jgi:hypothetical protein
MNYNNKYKQVEFDQFKNNTPKLIVLNENQKAEIRNEIKRLDGSYIHLLNSGNYDEMEKLRAQIANLEIKLR